jgi:hypothetical protein
MPTRTNLITNPSFEQDFNGWDGYTTSGSNTDTIDTAVAYDRSASYHISAAVASDAGRTMPFPSLAAGTYWFSARVKTGPTVGNACVVVRGRNDFAARVQANLSANQDWTLVSGSFTAEGGVDYDIIVGLGSYGSASAGDAWFDAVLLEKTSDTGGAFFDGCTSRGGYVYLWTGTPNSSTSLEVPGTGPSLHYPVPF